MKDIKIPSTAKQIKTQEILQQYRGLMLGDTLKKTVSNIAPCTLHTEIMAYVPQEGMKILQSAGIREEVVFALPCVITANPYLLGYYRLLMGISEKQFYSSVSGLAPFKNVEHSGKLNDHTQPEIEALCRELNLAINEFLVHLNKNFLKDDLRELPIMTLGVYADGVWRNIIGTQAARYVFDTIKGIIKAADASVLLNEEKCLVFENRRGEKFKASAGSDPDISIYQEDGRTAKMLCIEIKGGQDVANVHNRAGEAEKSHQKAALDGWKEKWTVIFYKGLKKEQRDKLLTESPSTDQWFDMNEVCAHAGESYEKFKKCLLDRFTLNEQKSAI